MGVSKVRAAENRQTILDTASRVFRERGVDGVGVADLMKEAGFTHGGFYNHFKSKEALAAETFEDVFKWAVEEFRLVSADGNGEAFTELLHYHLSEEHRDDLGQACPTGTLVTDAARGGEAMQTAFANGIEQFFLVFAEYFQKQRKTNDSAARESALALLSDMVGTLSLARATAKANPALSLEILKAGRARLPK